MAEGSLTVHLGPMFSGKTTTLVEAAGRLGRSKVEHRLLKPSFDNRYSETQVVSHDGVSLPCLSISGLPPIADSVCVVLIDEVQFFGMELIPWVRALLARGKTVLAVGLDMDWRGEPFIVSGALAAMADTVVKMTAICSVCGLATASKTFKIAGSSETIELGSADKYQARCNAHWSSGH